MLNFGYNPYGGCHLWSPTELTLKCKSEGNYVTLAADFSIENTQHQNDQHEHTSINLKVV